MSWYPKIDIPTPNKLIKGIDIEIKTKNYLRLSYMIIGLVGVLLLIYTYVPYVFYIYKYRKITGFPALYTYLAIIAYLMIGFYLYQIENVNIKTLITALGILFTFYYIIFFILLK